MKRYDNDDNKTFRTNEIDIQVVPTAPKENDYYILAQFNKKKNANLSAILSIFRTLFVCFVLAGAAIIFSKDATDLVLTPLENMLQKINNITKNPFEARKVEEDEAMVWERLMMENKDIAREMEEKENFETSMLQKIIGKIGGLLALGFG